MICYEAHNNEDKRTAWCCSGTERSLHCTGHRGLLHCTSSSFGATMGIPMLTSEFSFLFWYCGFAASTIFCYYLLKSRWCYLSSEWDYNKWDFKPRRELPSPIFGHSHRVCIDLFHLWFYDSRYSVSLWFLRVRILTVSFFMIVPTGKLLNLRSATGKTATFPSHSQRIVDILLINPFLLVTREHNNICA